MADNVVTYRYVMKMVAHKMGMMATFMPKPIFGDNASGMHVHQSLWTKGKNMMYDPKDEYAEISQTCRYYIGGLMDHARSLCAFTNPTTNSYRRLVPGYEAPVFIAWSKRNRSANIRIPMYYQGIEAAKRIEYRTPDPACNPYLSFAAMLCAGLDGVKRKIDPGNPVDEDLYHLSASKRKEYGVRELPGSLKESIEHLQTDYMFLKTVFPEDHDASDLRRRLDHRWSIQVPTGLRRLIGSDDLGRGPRPAELVTAVVRLLEPNREREPRLFRHDDRRARIGLGVRPPPRIHAEGGVHGGLPAQSHHLVGARGVRRSLWPEFHGHRDRDHLRLCIPPPHDHQRRLRPEPMVSGLRHREKMARLEEGLGDSERSLITRRPSHKKATSEALV